MSVGRVQWKASELRKTRIYNRIFAKYNRNTGMYDAIVPDSNKPHQIYSV